jgi:hypothetical protein
MTAASASISNESANTSAAMSTPNTSNPPSTRESSPGRNDRRRITPAGAANDREIQSIPRVYADRPLGRDCDHRGRIITHDVCYEKCRALATHPACVAPVRTKIRPSERTSRDRAPIPGAHAARLRPSAAFAAISPRPFHGRLLAGDARQNHPACIGRAGKSKINPSSPQGAPRFPPLGSQDFTFLRSAQ